MRKMKSALIAAAFAVLIAASNVHARSFGSLEFEESSMLPMVYLNIVADVGTVQDPQNKVGLASVAGDMFLRGTKTKSKIEILKTIDRLGASIGVDVRPEGTVIRVSCLSENLDEVLNLVNEILTEPAFPANELAKLKKETIGGIVSRKSRDRDLVARHFQKWLFPGHPYGYPVDGTERGVAAITLDDVRSYYTSYFGKGTLAMFGSGDAKKETLERWWKNLNNRLAQINPKAKLPAAVLEPEIPEGRRLLLVDKPNATQSHILFGHKGPRPEMKNFYALIVANDSFGGGNFEARLMKEIRVKRGWTYGAYNSFRYGRHPKNYATYFFPKTADTIPATKLALNLLEDFVKNGITPQEFEFSKTSLVNHAPFDYDTPRKRLENITTELLYSFPEDYFRDFANNVAKVDYESTKTVVKDFFNTANISMTILGDAKTLKPKVQELEGFSKPEVKPFLQD